MLFAIYVCNQGKFLRAKLRSFCSGLKNIFKYTVYILLDERFKWIFLYMEWVMCCLVSTFIIISIYSVDKIYGQTQKTFASLAKKHYSFKAKVA